MPAHEHAVSSAERIAVGAGPIGSLKDGRVHLFLLAGAILLGCLKAPMQVAIEFAQVQFNQISYPPDAAWGAYLASGWSLINQVIGLLLASGLGISLTTALITGLIFALFAEGFFRLAKVASDSAAIAAVLALAVICLRIGTLATPIYPVDIANTNTHGLVGIAWSILVIGLLATRALRVGGLCLGLAPALHATNGVWLFGCLGLAAAASFWLYRHDLAGSQALRQAARQVVPWAVLGLAGSGLSFLVFYTLSPRVDLPTEAYLEAPSYLRQYLTVWDPLLDGHFHPRPLGLVVPILGMVAILGGLTAGLARRSAHRGDVVAAGALSSLVVSAGLSGLLLVAATAMGEGMPTWFWRGMPGRWFDLTVMSGSVLVLAALLREGPRSSALGRATVVAIILTAAVDRVLIRLLPMDGDQAAMLGVLLNITVLSVGGAVALAVGRAGGGRGGPVARLVPGLKLLLGATLVISLGYFAARMVNENRPRPWPQSSSMAVYLRPADDRALWKQAAALPGMLLNGNCIQSLQSYSARPVTMSADFIILNLLPYRPELGPWIARDLRDFFDIDFFAPPGDVGDCPSASVRTAFEGRTRDAWLELGKRRGVGMVYAPLGWRIDLPEVARTALDVLYAIPASDAVQR